MAVDAGRVLVRLDADLRPARAASVGNSVLAVTSGTAVGVTAAALGVLLPVAVVPAVLLAGGGSWVARRSYRRALSQVQLALEQILDRLEHGEIREPPGAAAVALVDAALGAIIRRR